LRISSVFSFRKPSADALRRVLAIESTLDVTYGAVGATFGKAPMPQGFVVDHTRVELGRGRTVFERAKRALTKWRQFDLGWLEAFPTDTPLRVGETVLVLARVGGMWWGNAARIVYAVDESTTAVARFGFAYGTLPAHVERGEERFLIEWDRESDVVSYDILAFSRPRHYLVRLNSHRARTMQKRFAVESTTAMKRYIAEEE
jgi:uncharacterized protein (UPF0548 family)